MFLRHIAGRKVNDNAPIRHFLDHVGVEIELSRD